MSMGIVSDTDFEKELEKSNPKGQKPTIPEVIPMPRPGRTEGDNNVPDSLRKIIGETSAIEGRSEALELAQHFGLSSASVSAYANGSTSTASMSKRPNLNHINEAKERIGKKARGKLLKALHAITDDKLEIAKAVELAQIAKSMSGVVKDMEIGPESEKGKDKPQFIVYSPQIRDERHYEVTVVRE
jgi:hypothetical protein